MGTRLMPSCLEPVPPPPAAAAAANSCSVMQQQLHRPSFVSLRLRPLCSAPVSTPLPPSPSSPTSPLPPSPGASARGRRSVSMAGNSVQSNQAPAKESTDKCFELPSGRTPLEMIYLEGNSWFWTLNGMNILVDPVLVGNLDFGIPFLYDAAKKSKLMKEFTLDDLPKLDCILISQGFDDHCHKNILTAMFERFREVREIASPNAESIMGKIGYRNVTYLEPNDSTMLGGIGIRAVAGPVLGPPWQRPENGFGEREADVNVSPVNKQVLPAYTLVSGQEDAVKLAKFLQPKYLVTMKNAELDARGLLSMIVSENGTVDAFEEMLAKEVPHCQVLEPEPGTPFEVPVLKTTNVSGSK